MEIWDCAGFPHGTHTQPDWHNQGTELRVFMSLISIYSQLTFDAQANTVSRQHSSSCGWWRRRWPGLKMRLGFMLVGGAVIPPNLLFAWQHNHQTLSLIHPLHHVCIIYHSSQLNCSFRAGAESCVDVGVSLQLHVDPCWCHVITVRSFLHLDFSYCSLANVTSQSVFVQHE